MASLETTINGRYQLDRKPIGQGGMGTVYKAYDIVTKRYVALKTMRGSLSPAGLELFSKEWTVLAQLSHPNIVDVLDTGEFLHEGESRPFFVMPFLPGATLDRLMENASPRLTVNRVIGIISQACRGLQAAHERGLVHRDLKPSNIFVLEDDSVKIIDFGIVHLTDGDSVKALKGTLQYMSPEQIEMKTCTASSDIFSLAVVCYEALTGRKAFGRKTEFETAEAVRRQNPPPIFELNPLVNQLVSRVIHKAMAKDPWNRFSTAREFADFLQRAANGEVLERFNRSRIQPRIERAKEAHAEGDHQFASEILSELEAEGNIDPEMSLLRVQIDHSLRQKSIRQLLDGARTRLQEDEFPLALQKIQEVLEIDPDNAEAVSLRREIEKQRSQHQTENWFRLVEQHMHNQAFGQAKQALQEILKTNPNDTRARSLLVDVEHKAQEVERLRSEKEQLYQSAMSCYQRGEVSSALTKLERILDVTRRSPDSAIPERDAQYQSLYNQIRTERETARNAYAEGRRCLADRNFTKALDICNEFLKRSAGDPMFQALKLEVEEQVRQDQSAFIAEVSRRVEVEPDLDKRVNILKEAAARYPDEPHLQQSLRLVRDRRDLVNSIVERSRQYEERGQFSEALSQLDILRNIYAQYPGLEFEAERLKHRRDEQVRDEAKGRWMEQIDRYIVLGDYARARDLSRTALAEFPGDPELTGLERMAEGNLKRAAEAEAWMQRGQKLCQDRQFEEGLEALRKAASLDDRNAVIKAALLSALVEQARAILSRDWRAAEPLIEQALQIDPLYPPAKSLQDHILDYKRQEVVNGCVSQAREMQAAGDLSGALARVEEILAVYPHESRLVQLRSTLRNLGAVSRSIPAAAGAPQNGSPNSSVAGDAESIPTLSLPSSESGPSVADYTFIGNNPSPASPAPPVPLPQKSPRVPGIWTNLWERFKVLTATAGKHLRRPRKRLQDLAGPARHGSKLQWVVVGLAVLILALASAVTLSRKHKPPVKPTVITDFLVAFDSNVPGATFSVDQKQILPPAHLAAGQHTLEAFSLGYKPFSLAFSLSSSGPASQVIPVHLDPEMIRIRLVAPDLKSGTVKLDDHPPVDVSNASFSPGGITLSAEHLFTLFQSGRESVAFSFQGEPGRLAKVSQPIRATDLRAFVVTILAAQARIYAVGSSWKGGVKDQPLQQIPPEGLELSNLSGDSQIVVSDGTAVQPLPFEVSNAPTITVWLANDPNYGTLVVKTNFTDAEVWVDGQKQKPIRAGNNYYGRMAGTHTIKILREGYESSERTVQLKKGGMEPVEFLDLTPIRRLASLVIEGGTKDAEIRIDGASVGAIKSDGSFRMDNISPGSHSIGLRKQEFEDKDFTRTFAAGQPVQVVGPDVQMTPFGTIAFRVVPDNAAVAYRRTDESAFHPTDNGKAVPVKAGHYLVTARATGRAPQQEEVTVEPGKSKDVTWVLAPVSEGRKGSSPPPPPPPTLTTAEYFQDPASWTQTGNSWLHKGSGTSWLRNPGTYNIELAKQTSRSVGVFKRTKRVEWTIESDSNYRVEYTFDFTSLERRTTVDGKTAKATKPLVAQANSDSYTLQIQIDAERIIIRDAQGKEIDRIEPATRRGSLRFGFKGDVALVVRKLDR